MSSTNLGRSLRSLRMSWWCERRNSSYFNMASGTCMSAINTSIKWSTISVKTKSGANDSRQRSWSKSRHLVGRARTWQSWVKKSLIYKQRRTFIERRQSIYQLCNTRTWRSTRLLKWQWKRKFSAKRNASKLTRMRSNASTVWACSSIVRRKPLLKTETN